MLLRPVCSQDATPPPTRNLLLLCIFLFFLFFAAEDSGRKGGWGNSCTMPATYLSVLGGVHASVQRSVKSLPPSNISLITAVKFELNGDKRLSLYSRPKRKKKKREKKKVLFIQLNSVQVLTMNVANNAKKQPFSLWVFSHVNVSDLANSLSCKGRLSKAFSREACAITLRDNGRVRQADLLGENQFRRVI